ncbi:hypothetical protein EJ05DRAFT_25484 [Pseudovirgaria hyperparasitica]|uniref:Uncharacterized protein n=1 Tax=Pseudovirgaria hyperparasitica TaxID=470096 RepID=A0A6A6WLJ4_9PEZI|nr:uncharacterized protein EJ05DRAFT_25484 [Pseudovirgaria hyperparasitica]KAF2763090.1 hypothetical protein EJ05DRAFT_25484 [Pseudovirgaria hyperparasitica]
MSSFVPACLGSAPLSTSLRSEQHHLLSASQHVLTNAHARAPSASRSRRSTRGPYLLALHQLRPRSPTSCFRIRQPTNGHQHDASPCPSCTPRKARLVARVLFR